MTATSGAYTTSSAAHTIVPLHVLGDADDVVQERGDVVVDPDRVGLGRRRDPAVANDIGIAHDRTGEITGAQPVDRVRVPDAPDVEPVADAAQQLVERHRLGALEHDVGRRDARRAVELAAAAGAEAEAVARDERAPRRRGPRAPSFSRAAGSRSSRCVSYQLREAADEHAVLDELGPPGRAGPRR